MGNNAFSYNFKLLSLFFIIYGGIPGWFKVLSCYGNLKWLGGFFHSMPILPQYYANIVRYIRSWPAMIREDLWENITADFSNSLVFWV